MSIIEFLLIFTRAPLLSIVSKLSRKTNQGFETLFRTLLKLWLQRIAIIGFEEDNAKSIQIFFNHVRDPHKQ